MIPGDVLDCLEDLEIRVAAVPLGSAHMIDVGANIYLYREFGTDIWRIRHDQMGSDIGQFSTLFELQDWIINEYPGFSTISNG